MDLALSINWRCYKLLATNCSGFYLKKDRQYPSNLLHKENNLLKLIDQQKLLILQFVHRSVYPNHATPENVKNYCKRNTAVHNANTRDKLLLRPTIEIKTAMGATSIAWEDVSLWNKLPLNIRQISDPKLFKFTLKQFLMTDY